ncbi:hypothetical protein [Pedobacter rhizosphaerae]|uniref:Uncharacterized protein n=1 Tax=Pedobacter rhizosphaerae TaxID=390241 RepID=A0A1H9T1E5_9SPHI|nr:hypothetical protein [Pedobacter rhizosphaerae]SER91055.1 hypothetical protein SAMN04488023_12048 [Pedobacter rhizosphaerae]
MMVNFCKKHKTGFTDLIISVKDADLEQIDHRIKIWSVKDLETFKDIKWNTTQIKNFLKCKKPEQVFFTLLSGNRKSIFSKEIRDIEQQARQLGINHKRFHYLPEQGWEMASLGCIN